VDGRPQPQSDRLRHPRVPQLLAERAAAGAGDRVQGVREVAARCGGCRWRARVTRASLPELEQRERGRHREHCGGGDRLRDRVLDLDVHQERAEHQDGQERGRGDHGRGDPQAGEQGECAADLQAAHEEVHEGRQAVGRELVLQVLGRAAAVGRGLAGAQQPDIQQAERKDDLQDRGEVEGRHAAYCTGSPCGGPPRTRTTHQ
jgi:hypothetical protein